MPTRASDPTSASEHSPGFTAAAKQVAEHASTLAKLRLELVRLEAKNKVVAVGLGIGAAVVALYAVGFLFATIAVTLATVLDAWLALLLVTLGLFTIVAILVLVARGKLKGGDKPGRDNGHG